MNTKEYIALLKQYTQNTGVSIYDYYYQLAHFIKEADLESIPAWERHDPFLTKEDYQRLISCDEEDICRYFALAMEKTISLNLNAKEEKQENDIILENDENEFINCYNITPEKYYIDIEDKKYKLCYKTCRTCNGPGEAITTKICRITHNLFLLKLRGEEITNGFKDFNIYNEFLLDL